MAVNGNGFQLASGSRIGVVGGGPAGSFFSYFVLNMGRLLGMEFQLDIYEPRDFTCQGPGGCNMCGGIVSESLVQNLATEGIQLSSDVIQRSIDSYFLHMDTGDVKIGTPLQEHRIASVHRGGGPRGTIKIEGGGLDGFLLELAQKQGANRIKARVDTMTWDNNRPRLKTQAGEERTYDLVAVCVGINSSALKMFEGAGIAYKSPPATKTYICEFCFGRKMITRELGTSMHVFLLNLPRLEFAAFVPKGDYVTLCMLGEDIDKKLIGDFLESREVKQCLPPNWTMPKDYCHCSPKITVGSASRPFADRVVFIGDCGTTRLFKDGIGAAYRTAKAAARAAAFKGVSAETFEKHYWPVCKKINGDNRLGKFVFLVTRQIQKTTFARRALWRMVAREQLGTNGSRRMSSVLWDTFTGSAPYRDVLLRTLHPVFLAQFGWNLALSLMPERKHRSEAA